MSDNELDDDHLYNLVFNEMWEEAIARASTHPEEAKYIDDQHATSLHMACWHSAPVDAVNAIIQANPGSTILVDNAGHTPLHFACIHSGPEVVKQLLESNVWALTMRDHDDCTAFVSLYKENIGVVREALASTGPLSPLNSPIDMVGLTHFWEKACMFIRQLYYGTIDDPLPNGKKFLVLHACAGIFDLPMDMIWLAIKFQPEQLYEEDENGNFPLHVASKTVRKGSSTSNVIVDCLIAAYPYAARRYNNDRQLPLHLAIETYWGFDGGAVESILSAFPGALMVKDRTTGLYPFMHAAHDMCADLTKAFCLLRTLPELERFGNWRPREEEEAGWEGNLFAEKASVDGESELVTGTRMSKKRCRDEVDRGDFTT